MEKKVNVFSVNIIWVEKLKCINTFKHFNDIVSVVEKVIKKKKTDPLENC